MPQSGIQTHRRRDTSSGLNYFYRMQFLRKIGHIFRGWTKAMGARLGFRSLEDKEKKLSDLRLQLCGRCKYAAHKKVLEFINGDDVWVNALFCTKCKCPCLEKSLVAEEKCPMGYW
jgi:hypothetical protein